MSTYKSGTISIAPGNKTTMAFAPNDTARVKPLNFDEPARLDLNAYVIQIAKAVAPSSTLDPIFCVARNRAARLRYPSLSPPPPKLSSTDMMSEP